MGLLIERYSQNPENYPFCRRKWERFHKTPCFLEHLKRIYTQETGLKLIENSEGRIRSEIRRSLRYDWEKIHFIYAKSMALWPFTLD